MNHNVCQWFVVLCFGLLFNPLKAATTAYPVTSIPAILLKSSSMVKRVDETFIQVHSNAKATLYRKFAYTILNEAGQKFAYFSDYYDKFRQINSVTGTLYDAHGNKLRQIRKKDIEDEAGSDGATLMTDTRVKYHNFFYKNFPYTIEYEEEIELNGIFYFPAWNVMPADKIAIEGSKFSIQVPDDYQLRYKQFNYNREPLVETVSKGKRYTWELKEMPAIVEEPFGPDWEELVPSVFIAPTNFEIDGYRGTMDSWLSFGQFINQLYNGRDVLPQPIKNKIHQLSDNITDAKEKVRVLYEFMQQNTRYISIQLGIGGWQPFDASFVAAKKYGDCKALSNYMQAILKEAGIKAYSVLIRAGGEARRIIQDFPSNQFNHVITCAPIGKDTIWLECTSQTVAAGFMGSFTGNRAALLIAEDGGRLVNTPVYHAQSNKQIRKIEAVIEEDGKLLAEVYTRFTGEQQELQHHLIHDDTKENRDKYLNTKLNLPTYTVSKSDYKEVKGAIPEVFEYLKIESPSYASITGKRLFVQPNIFNKSGIKLEEDSTRKFDIVFRSEYLDIDTIVMKIPAGYTVEAMPASKQEHNDFGKYSISYKVSGNLIEVVRIRESNVKRLPSSSYPALIKWYETIYKADRSKVVLVKNG